MLCDYESSPSSTEERGDQITRRTLAMEFQADALRSSSKRKTTSPASSSSSDNSDEPHGPLITISKKRSTSRDRSVSKKHEKRHISKSESKHRSRHHEKSRHRRSSHSRSRRSTSRKHSRRKHRRHHGSHKRDRHHRLSSRHHRYRHKHRRHSSTSSSDSSSSSSSNGSSDKHNRSQKSSSKKNETKPSDTSTKLQQAPVISSTNPISSSTTTVTTTQASTSTAAPFVPRINPQEILDKIQKHQEAQAKAQAIAAAAAANLPKYYNPVAVNAVKLAEQQQKRKLLWSKKETDTGDSDKTSLWTTTSLIAGKGDSAAAAKFRKLMGIHNQSNSGAGDPNNGSHTVALNETDALRQAEDQAELFRRLEQEYEMSRTLTHTQRGVGLGFTAASHVNYSAYSAMQNETKDKEL